MVRIEDDKRYCLYYRLSRRVRWKYAEYGGRYETAKDAVAALKEHVHEWCEYQIEDMLGEEPDNTGVLEKH
jgi:hypothetical protein